MLTSQPFRLILLIATYAALGAGVPPPNTLSPDEKLAGWTLLFDGRTMNGWDDPRVKTPPGDAWTIEDGCLKANAHPRIVEDLFTKANYTDFELAFDWRISLHGNSGVKYRIQDHLFVVPPGAGESFEQSVERSFLNRVSERPARGQDYVIGFEYQILDSPPQIDRRQTSGALYDMVAPSSQTARPVGEFNHSQIVLRGNHVEHWLNGVKVVDTTLDAPQALRGIDTRWGCRASCQRHARETTQQILSHLAAEPRRRRLVSQSQDSSLEITMMSFGQPRQSVIRPSAGKCNSRFFSRFSRCVASRSRVLSGTCTVLPAGSI